MLKRFESRLARVEAQTNELFVRLCQAHHGPRIVCYEADASPEDLEARDAFFAAQHQAVPCACGQTGCPKMDGPVIFLPSKGARDQEGTDDAEEL